MNDPRFQSDDPEIDRLLNRVAVPEDFAARLKAIPVEEALLDESSLEEASPNGIYLDPAIDRRLQEVAVPPGLLSQLKAIAQSERATKGRATKGRPASTPAVSGNEEGQPPWRRRGTQVALWVTAASLLIAVGVWSYLLPTSPPGLDPSGAWLADDSGTNGGSLADFESLVVGLEPYSRPVIDQPRQAGDLALTGPLDAAPRDDAPLNDLAQLDRQDQEIDRHRVAHRTGFVHELPDNLMVDTFLLRWQPLGARPEVASVRPKPYLAHDHAQVSGVLPPSKGYDRDFVLRERSHPFVSPQADPSLATLGADLSPAETSFDRLILPGGSGRLPSWDHLRLEDCLAATSRYFVPAETAQLEIRTAAGPAVFAPADIHMLQVGVVAGKLPPEDRPPTHLTVAVERPGVSPHEEALWWRTKASLRRIMRSLGPHDTISLVVMEELPYTLVDGAGPKNEEAWLAALDQIEPSPARHLAEGIRYAASVAVGKPAFGDIRRPLVVLSEGFTHFDADLADRLRPIVEHAQQQNIEVHWVQLEDSVWIAPEDRHPLWTEVGTWHATDATHKIFATLSDALQGRSSVIGREARVVIRWNPEAVLEYRLLGHEPVGAGFTSGTTTAEFYPEDAASLLVELKLAASPPNEIAEVDLIWIDPASGQSRQSTQKVSLVQFADSWQASSLSLQTAQLTAQAVGLLQNSYYTRRRGSSIDELDRYAKQLSPIVREHPEFDRLDQLLDRARGSGLSR